MKSTKNSTLTVIFLAALILLAVTLLGSVPIDPINTATMHMPIITAPIVLGPRLGAFPGGTFGLISVIQGTVTQASLSFVLSPLIPVIGAEHGDWKALLTASIPRILIDVVSYFVYSGLRKLMKQKANIVSLFLAGLAGPLTNTILMTSMICFLFQQDYVKVTGTNLDAVYSVILVVIFTGGVPEGIVADLATMAVCNVLLRYFKYLSPHH